jgi:catechol 2,3-dioxygenase
MRLGYVHVRVSDLGAARTHYGDTLGMRLVHEEPDRLFYKAWDEYDHHSVVLESGGVGLAKLGYKCENVEDLSGYEKRIQQFGCLTERMSAGDNLAVGDGIRVVLPSDHVLELYADMEQTGTDTGVHNPAPIPRHTTGIGVPRVDHALVTCEDPLTEERFFAECLGFRSAERLITDFDDGKLLGSWMFCSNTPHDIAFIKGPNAKLHHFAYSASDWNDIKRASQLLAMDDVSIDVGPAQHGITRGETVYFFDPSGNRNEIFAGGYMTFPDFPTITWTADQLAKGIFYMGSELNERFTTVLT